MAESKIKRGRKTLAVVGSAGLLAVIAVLVLDIVFAGRVASLPNSVYIQGVIIVSTSAAVAAITIVTARWIYMNS